MTLRDVDIGGLSVAIAIGAILSAVGLAIDSLLLNRQSKSLDLFSIKWWLFFDRLTIDSIPITAIRWYISGKNLILGERFSAWFFVRSVVLSTALAMFATIIGRAAGLYLTLECGESVTGNENRHSFYDIINISIEYYKVSVSYYIYPLTAAFDLITILATVWLISYGLKRGGRVLLYVIIADILFCVILWQHALYIGDFLDGLTRICVRGYWYCIPDFINAFSYGCTAFHLTTSRVVFVSTILLPTVIYLFMMLTLLIMREVFNVMKYISMHILEKSVEGEKTLFAHIGTSLGVVVVIGKSILELLKLFP